MELSEEILKKYKLSEEEHNKTFEIIKNVYTAGKWPVERPIAVVLGGQTGAGKSALIGYSTLMFSDGNVVVINSDEIKPYHPKDKEIARDYPDFYTTITDQDSNTWTSQLFEELRREKYNIIFEGTMKNHRVADESIKELLQLGYTVIVRGLATHKLESRLSILERYIGEKEKKGYGRLVVPSHHDATYAGMPDTIDYIEKNGLYSVLEIYIRGSKNNNNTPQIIYANINDNYSDMTSKAIEGYNYVSHENNLNLFGSAKDAIFVGRELSEVESRTGINVGQTAAKRVEILKKYSNYPEVAIQIPDIEKLIKGSDEQDLKKNKKLD